MGGNRTDGGTTRWELVHAIATYKAPPLPGDDSQIKEEEECQGSKFWLTMDVETLAGAFNRMFRDNEMFKKLLKARLTERGELEEYHDEGGELV